MYVIVYKHIIDALQFFSGQTIFPIEIGIAGTILLILLNLPPMRRAFPGRG